MIIYLSGGTATYPEDVLPEVDLMLSFLRSYQARRKKDKEQGKVPPDKRLKRLIESRNKEIKSARKS